MIFLMLLQKKHVEIIAILHGAYKRQLEIDEK